MHTEPNNPQAQATAAIVGAGAAGLATAIHAAHSISKQSKQSPRIIILESAQRVGAKILVSGGGRCNVTNEKINADDYQSVRSTQKGQGAKAAKTHAPNSGKQSASGNSGKGDGGGRGGMGGGGGGARVIRYILNRFDEHATVEWFQSMGVQLKREPTGKLFPVTDSARTVLNALIDQCSQHQIEIQTNARVTNIQPTENNQWKITHTSGELTTDYLVMAAGGRSLPKTGSDGAAWAITRKLGHSLTDTSAALVPMILNDSFFHHKLSGISHDAQIETHVDGKRIDRRTGSLLWTHFGISGPLAMDASRFWTTAINQNHKAVQKLNVMQGQSFEQIDSWLIDGTLPPEKPTNKNATKSLINTLTNHLPRRVAETLCEHANVQSLTPLNQLPRDARRKLVHTLTDLTLPIIRHRGWNYAEVTAGGIPITEIDRHTMASRKHKSLYIVGEMLDCDGRIGGFNFQWAWATGFAAGTALAAAINQ